MKSSLTNRIQVVGLSSSVAVACYYGGDVNNNNEVTCSKLTLAATTLTKGPTLAMFSDASNYVSLARISDDTAVVCYTRWTGTVCNVLDASSASALSKSAGLLTGVDGIMHGVLSVAGFSDKRAIVCFQDTGASKAGTCTGLFVTTTTTTTTTTAAATGT